MEIHLPEELQPYERELRLLFDLMVTKLHLNRHKGFLDGMNYEKLLIELQGEIKELDGAWEKGSQFDVALESVDIGNFAVLIGIYALRMQKDEFVKERQSNTNQ